MARKPRVHFPGALYHVIARGNKGQRVFRQADDFKLYLKFLGEYKETFGVFVYAFVLMPTHVHLLVETKEEPLSSFMQRLLFRYTRNYNIRYQTWGHLFQGRYKAILCEKDSYLLELSAYIHLNPIRAGLTQDPLEYRWSSYPSYVGREKREIVDRGPILSLFSTEVGKAAKAYEKFVLERMAEGHRQDLYKVEDQRFLGPEGFLEGIKRGEKEKVRYFYDLSMEEIVSGVEGVFGIAAGLIGGLTRNRVGAMGRGIAGYLGRKLAKHRLNYMAGYFGREPASLCEAIEKVERRLLEDRDFHRKFMQTEAGLTEGRKKKRIF
jgi:REP element-mobilizing transposase RayT